MKRYRPRDQFLYLGQTKSTIILYWLWDGRSNKILRVTAASMWPTPSFHTAKSFKRGIASGEIIKDNE